MWSDSACLVKYEQIRLRGKVRLSFTGLLTVVRSGDEAAW